MKITSSGYPFRGVQQAATHNRTAPNWPVAFSSTAEVRSPIEVQKQASVADVERLLGDSPVQVWHVRESDSLDGVGEDRGHFYGHPADIVASLHDDGMINQFELSTVPADKVSGHAVKQPTARTRKPRDTARVNFFPSGSQYYTDGLFHKLPVAGRSEALSQWLNQAPETSGLKPSIDLKGRTSTSGFVFSWQQEREGATITPKA